MLSGLLVAKPDGEPLGRDGVAALGEASAEGVSGGVADGGELLPEDLAHLALGGREDDDLRLGARFDPPEDEAGEGPALAAPVRADDGDAAGGRDRFEHVALPGVGLPRRAENVLDEPDGVVLVLRIADAVVHACRSLTLTLSRREGTIRSLPLCDACAAA